MTNLTQQPLEYCTCTPDQYNECLVLFHEDTKNAVFAVFALPSTLDISQTDIVTEYTVTDMQLHIHYFDGNHVIYRPISLSEEHHQHSDFRTEVMLAEEVGHIVGDMGDAEAYVVTPAPLTNLSPSLAG